MKDPTSNWRNDASEASKRAMITARFGDETPDYLWYDLGEELKINDTMLTAATAPLFGDKKPGFGDIEIHESATPNIGRCLRVRGARMWQPKLTVGHRDCYLYMVGYAHDKRQFNFETQWNRARFLPGTQVRVASHARQIVADAKTGFTLRVHSPKNEQYAVIETRFDIGAQQWVNLWELASASPALENLVRILANLGQDIIKTIYGAELEVVIVTDNAGNRHEFCANVLEKAP